MVDTIWFILPWIMSCFTIWSMWLAGSKRTHAWTIGLLNQTLWLAFNIHYEVWGFMPTTVFLVFVYTRNLLKWKRENEKILSQKRENA